jgi:hypothetical protein
MFAKQVESFFFREWSERWARDALLVLDLLLAPFRLFFHLSLLILAPCHLLASCLSGVLHATYPKFMEAVLKALSLCNNLYSFTWIDDTPTLPIVFLSFLNILRDLPLRALTLRTYSDLGEDAWASINTFPNLQKVAIWCMDGPPRVLQGWAPLLGSTLTELELGVRIGHSVPITTHEQYHP